MRASEAKVTPMIMPLSTGSTVVVVLVMVDTNVLARFGSVAVKVMLDLSGEVR